MTIKNARQPKVIPSGSRKLSGKRSAPAGVYFASIAFFLSST